MITVLSAGILTTIQDLGRFSYASIGVPVSGAMDSFSASLANNVLGNPKNSAVIEITFGSCKLLFNKNTFICISGADFSAQINGVEIKLNHIIFIKQGDILSFGKQIFGVRTYLAVLGGFQSETIFGSRSFYKGITESWRLVKNQQVEIKESLNIKKLKNVSIKVDQELYQTKKLFCFEGPEFNLLTNNQKEKLLNLEYTISTRNNRMGYQLKEKLPNKLPSMLTSAVLPGTVQLTPNGTLIVLMKDCQVTGGYPRVLQLSEESICMISQKTTNQNFGFQL